MVLNPTSLYSKATPLFAYLNKQRENQKFSRAVEISVTLLLISLLTLFAIRPAIVTISGLVGQIKAKEIQSQQMRQKINNVIQAQDQFSLVQEKYQIIESSLPNSPQYAHGISQLEAISQKMGFSIDPVTIDLDPGQSDNTPSFPNLAKYSVSISQAVSFSQIATLLLEIQNNRRLIRTEKVTLSQPASPVNQPTPVLGQVTTSLTADIYYWRGSKSK